MARIFYIALGLLALLGFVQAAPKEGDCEVCLNSIKEIETRLKGDKKDLVKTEAEIDKFCDKPRNVSINSDVQISSEEIERDFLGVLFARHW